MSTLDPLTIAFFGGLALLIIMAIGNATKGNKKP